MKNLNSLKNLTSSSRVTFLIFRELILGMMLSVLSFFVFIKLRSEVLEKELLSFDDGVMNFFYLHRTPLLTKVMIAASFLGYELLIIIGILLFLVFWFKNYKKEALLFAFTTGMAPVIDAILKNIIQRPRPYFYPLTSTSGYSFPSGHVMNSFVFYATLSYFLY